ncbi:NAD(P)/FAD-dependent oxidoreductase [Alteribacillus sp. YIM 98480]|uniref:FAD-dependent oxidoreductase n=1 Tax=Alteribacillus sp. YIM 98480 TaxID=2606599 RepID=UPI00131D155E|nr:NAD(P)/FAD-dependent oxidoreductase [Alteribacillus sp. YIM 98480]
MKKRYAEIAGAGISGLTAAIALAQRGWKVRIHERSSKLREIGAGLYTWENGLKVLETIGAFNEACSELDMMERMDMVNEHQELIHSIPFSSENRFTVISRQGLYKALINRAQEEGVDIYTKSPVAGAKSHGELILDDGRQISADLIIGADGVRSKIRNSLNLTKNVETMDDGAIRVLIPKRKDDPDKISTENWSGYRRIGVTPCGPNYVYVFLTGLAKDEALSVPINKEIWQEAFPHLESVIERVDEFGRLDYHFFNVFCKRWSSGSVALLGDAAHGMSPNLGQGAGTGMMSALELAESLESYNTIEAALDAWEKIIRPTIDNTQYYARLYSLAATKWPKELLTDRYPLIQAAMESRYLEEKISKAASYVISSYRCGIRQTTEKI